jgi:hypothetical protein
MRAARPIATKRAPHYTSTTYAGSMTTDGQLTWDKERRPDAWHL